MPRWREDEVDVAAYAWAYQWVQHFLPVAPDRAGRMIGPLACTLGRVRTMGDGAASRTEYGRRDWPEVFLGSGLVVAVALQAMSETQRLVTWNHYVGRRYNLETGLELRRPVKQAIVAARLEISPAEYYHRRDTAKSCLRVALTLDTKDLAWARLEAVEPVERAGLPFAR